MKRILAIIITTIDQKSFSRVDVADEDFKKLRITNQIGTNRSLWRRTHNFERFKRWWRYTQGHEGQRSSYERLISLCNYSRSYTNLEFWEQFDFEENIKNPIVHSNKGKISRPIADCLPSRSRDNKGWDEIRNSWKLDITIWHTGTHCYIWLCPTSVALSHRR